MWRLIWAMFGLICAYQWVDGYQTYLLIGMGFEEANPLIKWYIKQFDIIPGLLLHKLLFSIALGVALYWYQKKRKIS